MLSVIKTSPILIYIIDAACVSWRSEVYNHYNVSIKHIVDSTTGAKLMIHYVFTCKTHPDNHTTVRTRARTKTGNGTTNLQKDVDLCLKKQGIEHQRKVHHSLEYSESAHHAFIVLRCATSSQPINLVLDEDYQMEVEMLRPGTHLPHPMIVQ